MKRFGTGGLLCCLAMDSIAPPGGTKNPPCFSRGSVSELQFGKLGMIDTRTGRVIELNVPAILGNPEDLHSIVVTPDGNVWFTSSGANALVCYSPEKSSFTFFQLPLPNSGLFGLALDVAGRLWFTSGGGQQANYVGVMTP